jgi:hypothetical protein
MPTTNPRQTVISCRAKRGASFSVHYDAVDNTWGLDAMMVVLLTDIRDELQALNALLGCANFTGIPGTLKGIERNTTKRTRTRNTKGTV